MSGDASPLNGSTRVLDFRVTPAQADAVVESLRERVRRLPEHPALIPTLDVIVADDRVCLVTPGVVGDSLDHALRQYGPAAMADALPRLAQLASALDAAAARGVWHGALTPRDVIVTERETRLLGLGVVQVAEQFGLPRPAAAAYTAPELHSGTGGARTPAADQYALAVIAYEWFFGRIVSSDDDLGLVMPTLPDVDRGALVAAFERALSRAPGDRFDSCTTFVRALAASVQGPMEQAALPLDDMDVDATATHAEPVMTAPVVVPFTVDELPIDKSDADAEVSHPPATQLADAVGAPRRGRRGLAVAATLAAGLAAGALAIWFVRNGGLSENTTDSARPFTDATVAEAPGDVTATEAATVTEPVVNPPRDDGPQQLAVVPERVAPPPKTVDQPRAVPASTTTRTSQQGEAGLLVHSTPAGADVTVDGVRRGTTPIAVRGLSLGTRHVVVSRAGYLPAERAVTLTAERPSRALEFTLTPIARTTTAAPVAAGSLLVDSRPVGATVIVDGRVVGVTPLVLGDVTPGSHTVRLEREAYRPVTTTVVVRAGERARVAARLEAQQDDE